MLFPCIVEPKPALMKCPTCNATQFQKNGHRRGKQNYRCKNCGRQYLEAYLHKGYSDDVKQICIRMYESGLTLRQIERLTGISHSTIYNWAKKGASNPSAEPGSTSD
jgi:transposase-like protein